jgi:hypothetical protein
LFVHLGGTQSAKHCVGYKEYKDEDIVSIFKKLRVKKENPAQQRNSNHRIVFATPQADPAHGTHPGPQLPVET